MIISHRKKFAFFANQKTGSKAVGLMLRLSGVFDENDIMAMQPFPATRTAAIELPAYNIGDYNNMGKVTHMTPQDAIDEGFITLEQLREYNCYAFLREPKERFLASRAAMRQDRNGNVAMPGRRVAGVAGPQYKFFYVGEEQVVTPLDFGNYEQEMRKLLDSIGAYYHMDMPAVKRTFSVHMESMYTYNPQQHTRDIQLYKEMIRGSL